MKFIKFTYFLIGKNFNEQYRGDVHTFHEFEIMKNEKFMKNYSAIRLHIMKNVSFIKKISEANLQLEFLTHNHFGDISIFLFFYFSQL
jgi:hypothetical protein